MDWSHISALGGVNLTALGALASAAWLVGARCWRLALVWCLLFGAALVVAAASQVAFIGWGVGLREFDFTGFSGHATRAAALYPVVLFLLFERSRATRRHAAALCGALLGAAVALARIKVGAHAPSEAWSGFGLGLAAALLFIRCASSNRRGAPRPLLVGLALALLLLPKSESADAHQWLTALALAVSGHDRPYLRATWSQAPAPYVPPCLPAKRRFVTICT